MRRTMTEETLLSRARSRRGSENARGVLAVRAVVERRCVTRASLCRLARVSRGAPRPPRKNSPLRVCPLVSLGAVPSTGRFHRAAVNPTEPVHRGRRSFRSRAPIEIPRGRFGSREFCGFERVELSPGIPTPINRRFTVRFPVERGFTILSTNEIARLRVFCFASRRFPMDT